MSTDVHCLKAFCAKVYGLQMRVDQWGPSIAVLEAVLDYFTCFLNPAMGLNTLLNVRAPFNHTRKCFDAL